MKAAFKSAKESLPMTIVSSNEIYSMPRIERVSRETDIQKHNLTVTDYRPYNRSIGQSPWLKKNAFLPAMTQNSKRLKSINHKIAMNRVNFRPSIDTKFHLGEMPTLTTVISPNEKFYIGETRLMTTFPSFNSGSYQKRRRQKPRRLDQTY